MIKSERAFTLIELVVGMFAMVVILTAILGLVKVSTSNQDRIAERVAANQKVRPVMQRLIDTLHSACFAPGVSPIQAGSTGSSMIVVSQTGSGVQPIPDKRVITLSGSIVTEQVYPVTGGTLPSYTYAASPSSTRQLLDGVSAGSVGSPAVAVPLFRYYAYVGDTISATPLTTPLSVADAARTAHVAIAFAGAPAANVTGPEQKSAITVADSANLRLESAVDTGGATNLPCV
jgi:type II secretory pathway pseudopilin PulG